MSQKMALLLSAALTVFMVIVAGALAVRLGGSTPATTQAVEPTQVETEAAASPNALDVLLQREQCYRQHVEEANAQTQLTSDQMRTLQAQLQRLQAQNATLLEREQTYRQRLQEANRLLQQLEPSAPAGYDGTSVQWQEASRAMDSSRAGSVRLKKDERKREHDKGARDHHDEEEEEDDD